MANERLRQAIRDAGLDEDQLAGLVKVDVKTVQRWVSGRTPRPRHRGLVAKPLGVHERELWPEAVFDAPAQDPRREIIAALPQANDLRAPDWRAMLKDAVHTIDLLDLTLLDITGTPGVIELLQAKARSGCQVRRILIAAPDSVWVTTTAQQLRQDQEDDVGRNELEREIDFARGYLEPLTTHPNITLRSYYAERANSIIRVDDQMLLTLHLYGAPSQQAPLLHIRRHSDDGLIDQFLAHLDAIRDEASDPIQPNPERYPHPRQHPDRYQPATPASDPTEPAPQRTS
jgi:transcriptional regulator with XRE-family HTH domain